MRAFALSLVLIALPGCAAFRPMDGVPARYLPEELKGRSRADQQMIDLSLLRRPQNNDYRVDAGDVLAVYIENILGRPDVPPINQSLDPNRPPTLGYPLTVRDDGTLAVPRFGPILVRGKSIPDVEATIRNAFTYQRRFMQPGQNDRVVVSLHQPRQHRVLVVRQESQSDALSSVNISSGQLGGTKKGTGKIVSLPAYKNDVMHALVESGGLPGLDAQAVVWVIRSKKEPQQITQAGFNQPQFPPIPNSPYGSNPNMRYGPNPNSQFGPNPNSQFDPNSVGPNPNLPIIMGPTRQYPVPSSVAPNSPMTYPNGQPMMAPQGSQGSNQQPNLIPVPTSYPGMQNNGMLPGGQAPLARHSDSSSGIQQAAYWSPQTPRQIAESLAGVPTPPRNQFDTNQAQADASSTRANGHVNMSGENLSQSVSGHQMPGYVQQSGCSTCQTGQGMYPPTFGPNAAFGQSFAGPMPQSFPMSNDSFGNGPPMSQWQQPNSWDNIDMIAQGSLCDPNSGQTIRIPLRLSHSEAIGFSPQDVVLEDGDIVFIQSRDDEVFYTGGLLGGGQYSLPRDSDLDILEAIAIAQSRSGGSQDTGRSALNNDVTISASRAIVIRKLPNGSQVPIMVNLYRARQQPSERIAIRPGDYIILQYTKLEATGAFIERHILEGALFGFAAAQLGTGRR